MLFRSNLAKPKIVAIGPFTAEELKKFGVEPLVSSIHTVSGALQTIRWME